MRSRILEKYGARVRREVESRKNARARVGREVESRENAGLASGARSNLGEMRGLALGARSNLGEMRHCNYEIRIKNESDRSKTCLLYTSDAADEL